MSLSTSTELFLDNEIWKDIPDYKGYQISSFGRVRSFIIHYSHERRYSVSSFRILKGGVDKDGYRRLILCKENGDRKSIKFYELVCLHFIGQKPTGLVITHLDGDKVNDCLSNLAYRTQKENILDKNKHGTMPRGELHCCSKLKNSDVCEIRSSNKSCKELSLKFGVNSANISAVRTRRLWKHLP